IRDGHVTGFRRVLFRSLGARVQVIQDRIVISAENRARLVEAIETALRFGKGKINIVPILEGRAPSRPTNGADSAALSKSAIRAPQSEIPFSTGWHCAHCDLDIRA